MNASTPHVHVHRCNSTTCTTDQLTNSRIGTIHPETCGVLGPLPQHQGNGDPQRILQLSRELSPTAMTDTDSNQDHREMDSQQLLQENINPQMMSLLQTMSEMLSNLERNQVDMRVQNAEIRRNQQNVDSQITHLWETLRRPQVQFRTVASENPPFPPASQSSTTRR